MLWNARSYLVLACATFSLLLSCGSGFADGSASHPPTQSRVVTKEVIKALRAAKGADWQAAQDPQVSTARRETFLNQMNKADYAMKELNHGFEVPQRELNDALWVPPKHMTTAERSKLIARLQMAREQDDANEQQMLNDIGWTYSGPPAGTVEFDTRKAKIDRLIKDLEIGEPVHYSDVKEALAVIPSPY